MVPDPMQTPELAGRQGAGEGMFDARQFQEIYNLLKFVAMAQGVDAGEASELAQEAMTQWVALARRMEGALRFESDGARRGWARRIFGFVLSKHYERRRRQAAAELPSDLEGDEERPSGAIVRDALKVVVDRSIARLDDKEQAAVRHFLDDSCNGEEIGRRLGMTGTGARKLLDRALKKLARYLADFDPKNEA